MKFIITHFDKTARLGKIIINNKIANTPLFMPIATIGVVKSLTSEEISSIGFKLLLNNALHLYFRPGLEVIKLHNGVHQFMNWKNLILTDSGGFQLFSLSKFCSISKLGIKFINPINGKKLFLTPKKAIQIQYQLNSDILMVLDDCSKNGINKTQALKSLYYSIHWAKLCKQTFEYMNNNSKNLFGIIQGNFYQNLRKISIIKLLKLNFDGYAIGGVSVGESKFLMNKIIKFCCDNLPNHKPRYVMGIGQPLDILTAVYYGADMFDCVLPTRNARNGYLYVNTYETIIRIKNKQFHNDNTVLDPTCSCYTCAHYTRSYLHHLHTCNDPLSARLNTIHNLNYYHQLMINIRQAIKHKTFLTMLNNFVENSKYPPKFINKYI